MLKFKNMTTLIINKENFQEKITVLYNDLINYWEIKVETPKSATLISPLSSTKILAALMSLWIMFF